MNSHPQSADAVASEDALLTVATLIDLTCMSKSTLRRFEHSGEMPQPIFLGKNIKRWRSREIRQWMRTLQDQGTMRV